MNRGVRQLVRQRAGNRCEYCHLPQEAAPLARFHVEHVIPRQHGGGDDEDNLCLSCARCNFSKGPNLTGIDFDSGKVAMLFHPRRQNWRRHFRWDGPLLVGITRTGRATIAVLDINHPQRVELRDRLLEQGEALP
jgi:HNH endonuclease